MDRISEICFNLAMGVLLVLGINTPIWLITELLK